MVFIDDRLDNKPERTAPVTNTVTTSFMWIESTAGQRCELFEKKWLDCASKLGKGKGEIECKLELQDLEQCKKLDIVYKR